MHSIYSENFAQFWNAYPRHVCKGAAWKAFQKLAPTEEDVTMMIAALSWQREQPQWLEAGGRFTPHASTWLNARQWEDEPFHVPAKPRYVGWECPHQPPCEQRHWCALKTAREEMGK